MQNYPLDKELSQSLMLTMCSRCVIATASVKITVKNITHKSVDGPVRDKAVTSLTFEFQSLR